MSMETNMGPGPFYRDDGESAREPGGISPEILAVQKALTEEETQETGEQDE